MCYHSGSRVVCNSRFLIALGHGPEPGLARAGDGRPAAAQRLAPPLPLPAGADGNVCRYHPLQGLQEGRMVLHRPDWAPQGQDRQGRLPAPPDRELRCGTEKGTAAPFAGQCPCCVARWPAGRSRTAGVLDPDHRDRLLHCPPLRRDVAQAAAHRQYPADPAVHVPPSHESRTTRLHHHPVGTLAAVPATGHSAVPATPGFKCCGMQGPQQARRLCLQGPAPGPARALRP